MPGSSVAIGNTIPVQRHVPKGEQAWATNTQMLGQTRTNGMAISSHNARFPLKQSANMNDAIQAQANQIAIWMV